MEEVKKEEISKEIDELIVLGKCLYVKLQLEEGGYSYDDPPLERDEDEDEDEHADYIRQNEKRREASEQARDFAKDISSFAGDYERFYTLSLKVVQALAPERLEDFKRQYRDERRKEVSVATYLISDAIVGYKHTFGNYDRTSALPRVWTQISILEAIKKNVSIVLNDIDALIRADLFDSELASASHLLSRGHIRASGAVAGVVLEKHLAVTAQNYSFKTRKKHPSIADYNEHLKESNVVDLVVWRRIQSLGDIRNSCDHQKAREPSSEDVEDLIRGVTRIIKEVN